MRTAVSILLGSIGAVLLGGGTLDAQTAGVRVQPIDGEAFDARWAGDVATEPATWSFVTATGERSLPVDDTSAITFVDRDRRSIEPLPARTGRLWLRSGSTFPAEFVGGAREGRIAARLDVSGSESVEFALVHVAGLLLRDDAALAARFEQARLAPDSTRDIVFVQLKSGGDLQRRRLVVAGITAESLLVRVGDETRSIGLDRVGGVVFGTDNGTAPAPLGKPIARVLLEDGRLIRGNVRSSGADTLGIATAEGATLELPLAHVVRIDVQSSKLAHLADAEPTQVEHTAAFRRERPWLRNRTSVGDGIVLGGVRHRRGLFVPPRTKLTWTLDDTTGLGGFNAFETTVGIDDRANAYAHANVRILADDAIVFRADGMTLGEPPRRVRVDLTGVRTLSIETDFAKNFDLGDHCVFADARLVRNGS